MLLKKKINSNVQEKWFNEWYAACVNYYHNYFYDICKLWSTTIYFLEKSGVDGVSFPLNSISPNDPVMKAWKYEMGVYLMEILDLKYPFFSRLTKFQ